MEQITLNLDERAQAVLQEIQFRFGHDPHELMQRVVSYLTTTYVKSPILAGQFIRAVMKGGV